MCGDQDYNTLKCCCGPHDGPVMKFTIDTKGISEEDVESAVKSIRESMYKKPLIDPETGEVDYNYRPKDITQDLFIPIASDSKTELRGSCSLAGNMTAPSYLSEEAKEDYYHQLKSIHGDKFDEETKQLRIDNMKINPNTGGIYSVSSRSFTDAQNENKGIFKKFLSGIVKHMRTGL